MKRSKFLLISTMLAVLTACGGGGGGSSSSGTSTTIAGAVIDGYIEGATVCLDVNDNGVCDASEPSVVTGANGAYTLSYAGDTKGLHVISVIPATAKDADDNGLTLQQAGKSAYTLMAPAPITSSARPSA